MQRYQKPRGTRSTDDELAATKAAAWAWYQRGSASHPKYTSEFGLARTHRVPNPTRYKLEAEKSKARSSSNTNLPSDHDRDDSRLFDRYEMESISKQLENYMDMSNSRDCGHHRKVAFSPESDASGMIKKEEKKSKRLTKGFWLIRYGMACGGSRDDVVEFGRGLRDRVRRQEKGGGGVVGVAADWRPRVNHV